VTSRCDTLKLYTLDLNKAYANPFWLSLTASIMFLFCSFCIIEGPETIEDFVQMQSQEIEDNIKGRRNKIFLLMEEVFSFADYVFHLSNSSYPFVALLRQHCEVLCMGKLNQVRRLRVQQRIRTSESKDANTEENEMPEIPSTIPFMPDAVTNSMLELISTSWPNGQLGP
jgi:hypothetical protein